MQLDHERDQVVAVSLRDADKLGDTVGSVHHIGIGKQEKIRLKLGRRFDSLLQRPQFSRPAGRKRLPCNNGQSRALFKIFRGLPRDLNRSVATAIIHENNVQGSTVLLPEQ